MAFRVKGTEKFFIRLIELRVDAVRYKADVRTNKILQVLNEKPSKVIGFIYIS
jgi:hypothetical protein